MPELRELAAMGQSVWLDYIRRAFIISGELQALVNEGVTGLTSNPTIFEKAIAGSGDYDEALRQLVEEGKLVGEIYEALVVEDIRRAADVLRPVYERTDGVDGYVSLEVSPTLADDTEGTIDQARRLFALVDRPNLLIKVPATPAGIPALEALIAGGINVNVTLVFSVAQYEAVAEAYISGLERRLSEGKDISHVASVASFFVSRVDAAVDKELEALGNTDLQGKIAIANAKLVYARFREIIAGTRWANLAAHGARVQRPLWASTGPRDPRYPATLYVDNLIGPYTINTMPPHTLQLFKERGRVAPTLEMGLDEARAQMSRLANLGLYLSAIAVRLQEEGVGAFTRSFWTLMSSIAAKRAQILAGRQPRRASLGPYQATVDAALAKMAEERIMPRIWAHDHTVWKPEPTEISNRLGWLHVAEAMLEKVDQLNELTEAVREAGYTDAVLLGMGGSSLGPEVLRKTMGVKEGYLDLSVLDSTDPDAVLAYTERLDPARTLFIVATKSGSTVETLSLFEFFYHWETQAVGADKAGRHFVAITDPGAKLADLAAQYRFRSTFLNDPNIGGRYSVLSYFGLVPAALIGVDVSLLLDRAMTVACAAESCVAVEGNPSAWLGAILGELAKAGRDKLTLIISPSIASFGDWIEQLIAESTGKEGKGILPVVGEPIGPPEVYGDDRLFVYLRLDGEPTYDAQVQALEEAGFPVVRWHLHDTYDLGKQFFLWEMATAVAGHLLQINPFDQPNVEAAKVLARQMLEAYLRTGQLPEEEPVLRADGILVYDNVVGNTPGEILRSFLAQAITSVPGRSYVALQAYVEPTPQTDQALQVLRTRLRDRLKLATTVGYGPRFLHSTGQLHKGDAGHGLFVQFTADDAHIVRIPMNGGLSGSPITFGVLKAAQALGDRQALLAAGRKVIRFHFGVDVVSGLRRLAEAI